MEFKIRQRMHPNQPKYTDDFPLAKKFAEEVKKELGDFLKSVVLFGSTARAEKTLHEKDIDILMIVNDLTAIMNAEVIEAYRIITENTASKISKRMHITTMKLTSFWDYVRNGDPIVVNMLRDGMPLHDTGFFEPAQQLLFQGRILPSKESMLAYFTRAPNTLLNAEWHVLQACLDLYWAVADSAHAALMKHGELPPGPGELAEKINEKLVKKRITSKKHADTVKLFYDLSKKITHKEIVSLTGKQFDEYHAIAKEFLKEMKRIVEGR